MRILKTILIFVAVFALIFLGGMLVLPSEVHVERSVVINASPDEVYEKINSMHNFNDWNPWYKLDPEAKYKLEGPETGVGSKMSWISEKDDVGSGSQWITEAVPGKMIKSELSFEGFDDHAFATLSLEPVSNGTRVVWSFESRMRGAYKYMGLMMDGMMGPTYEEGLENLKTLVESV